MQRLSRQKCRQKRSKRNKNSIFNLISCEVSVELSVFLWRTVLTRKDYLRSRVTLKIFQDLGTRIEDINQYIIPIIKKLTDHLIFHVGTNDVTNNTSKTIVDNLLLLKSNISNKLPSCRIVFSKPSFDMMMIKQTLRCVMFINTCQLYILITLKKITSVHIILDRKDYI